MPPQPEPRPRVVGYVRVSTAREEMVSPELQQASIEDYCRRKGYQLDEVIADLDATGRNFTRKGVQRAIEMVENAGVTVVVVWKFSRFGRDRKGWAVNLDRVESAGGRLESATEDVDATHSTGRFTRGMLAEVAAWESDRIGEGWQEARDHRHHEGLPGGGGKRFGYVLLGRVPDPLNPGHTRRIPGEPERYEPDPETGQILADLYRRYNRGQTMVSLTAMLGREGVRNAHGRPWGSRALTNYLDSGFGAGLLRVHAAACRCGRPKRCRNSDYLPGAHKALITDAEWRTYRERRGVVSATAPRVLAGTYLLSGLVRCGECRGAMVANTSRGQRGKLYRCARWREYRDCSGSWPQRTVMEQAVRDALAGWAADLELHGHITQARRTAWAAAEVVADRAQRELAAAERALTRLAIQRATDEDMPKVVYESARAELLEQRVRAELELEKAKASAGEPVADYLPLITELLAEWDLMPTAYRQNLLSRLLRHVTSFRTGHRLPARIVVTPIWETCDASCCA